MPYGSFFFVSCLFSWPSHFFYVSGYSFYFSLLLFSKIQQQKLVMLLGMKWREFVANNPLKGERPPDIPAPVIVSVKTPSGSPATPQRGKVLQHFRLTFFFVVVGVVGGGGYVIKLEYNMFFRVVNLLAASLWVFKSLVTTTYFFIHMSKS